MGGTLRNQGVRRSRWALVVALGLSLGLWMGASGGDPGLLLELDREGFQLAARDLARPQAGPRLRVALGSPAHPTPSGAFPLRQVVLNPGWTPGPRALAAGAQPELPSDDGPLGVAKIPFAADGAIALHGGAHPRLLGKPVSLGCVRAMDGDLLALIAWLGEREALGPARQGPDGEVVRRFRRRVQLLVR